MWSESETPAEGVVKLDTWTFVDPRRVEAVEWIAGERRVRVNLSSGNDLEVRTDPMETPEQAVQRVVSMLFAPKGGALQ